MVLWTKASQQRAAPLHESVIYLTCPVAEHCGWSSSSACVPVFFPGTSRARLCLESSLPGARSLWGRRWEALAAGMSASVRPRPGLLELSLGRQQSSLAGAVRAKLSCHSSSRRALGGSELLLPSAGTLSSTCFPAWGGGHP